MLRLIFSRIALIGFLLASWTLTVLKFGMDWIGRTTAADDFNQLVDRAPFLLSWLSTVPWWVPALVAVSLTVALVWSTVKQTLAVVGPIERRAQEELNKQEKRRAELISASDTVQKMRARQQYLLDHLLSNRAEINAINALWGAGELNHEEMQQRLSALKEIRKSQGNLLEDPALDDAALFLDDGTRNLLAHRHSSVVADVLPNYASLKHAALHGTIERDIKQVEEMLSDAIAKIEEERSRLLAGFYLASRRPKLLAIFGLR